MTLEMQWQNEFAIFSDLDLFSQAIENEAKKAVDLEAIVRLNTNFIDANEQFLLLNLKDFEVDEPNNILFLTEQKAFLFSKRPPRLQEAETFKDILHKPFGRSTALCFLTMDNVLERHDKELVKLMSRIAQMEEHYDHSEYRNLLFEFERLIDNLEDLHELLLKLQERKIKHVETRFISFDYQVLIAESSGLQAKCRRRLNVLRDLRQDHEMMATEELNQRIIKLNEVVKKLTAITVILMLPTLIASHFGMNFAFMPELRVWWAYPVVIVFQLVVVGAGIYMFRKIGWL